MMRAPITLSLLLAVSGSGCLEMFKTSPTSPTEVTAEAFGGSWVSVAASTVEQVCTSFQWEVTDISLTGASGAWSAVCYGDVEVAGTAAGTLNADGRLRWTATGAGIAPNVGACEVALTGTATLEGTQIRVPYSGTTCLGEVSGTEILRKS